MQTCPDGNFCDDCSCDGAEVIALGDSVNDGRVLYDAFLDTFRVAYFQSGSFRLRAVGPKGGLGNDVTAVASVSKLTEWGVTQNETTGKFFFAWTGYPDSAIRVGVASPAGTIESQSIVLPDLVGSLDRRNVQIGRHAATDSLLVAFEELTSNAGRDVRAVLLDGEGADPGAAFNLGAGMGEQIGPRLASRGDAGYVLTYGTMVGNASPPQFRVMDGSGAGGLLFSLSPDGQAQTSPHLWYEPTLQTGLVQWLGTDSTYHQRLVGPEGAIADELDFSSPVGVAFGAPVSGVIRTVYLSVGEARMRSLNVTTGATVGVVKTVSSGGATKIIGAAAHADGYALVVWTKGSELQGRLIAP